MTEPSGLQTTRPFRPVICTEKRGAVIREATQATSTGCSGGQSTTGFSDSQEGKQALFQLQLPLLAFFLLTSATQIYSTVKGYLSHVLRSPKVIDQFVQGIER